MAGRETAINMIEAGAKKINEDEMLEALMFGHDAVNKLCKFEKEIAKKIGKEKRPLNIYKIDEDLDNYYLNYVSEGQKKLIKKDLLLLVQLKIN